MQINIGLIGLGTVGCGTVDILHRNHDLIAQRTGLDLRVTRIATRDPGKQRPVAIEAKLLTASVDDVLNDPDIHIVVEVVGGVEPVHGYVSRAIASGKSVVTANKELIAKHGAELLNDAADAGVDLLFEGSVAGGIPLLKPLRESLVGNRILRLSGIVNGTTNYILTKMARERHGFDEVLAEAQALGYAEADPTADVDAYDATYKLAILATIAFGTPVRERDIYREGIRKVTLRDIENARGLGYVIKLVASAWQHEDGELELRVHPTLLPVDHPLANVNDAFNAVLVEGDAVGEVMFFGRGAGGQPTGSAVVGDIVEAARNIAAGASGHPRPHPLHTARIKDFAEVETRFCVRMQVVDRPGMLAQIAGVFGEKGVSLESIVQQKSDGGTAEVFWMTHLTSQRAMGRSLNEFNRLDAVREVSSVLRVEGE